MSLPPSVICDADPTALSIEQALQHIISALPPIKDTETIEASQAFGRINAQDIYSPISVPSFRASAMDGYAVKANECDDTLTLSGQSMAGHPGSNQLDTQTCQRITTGARVPDEADAVVQQENVEREGDRITVLTKPSVGQHIRLPGSDSQKGELLIPMACRLGPSQLALMAAHGIEKVTVLRPLSIALLSTGDELREPGTALGPGQIYDANRPLLRAMLEDHAVKLIDLGICEDSEPALQHQLEAAQNVDMIISSGGVSVGDADFVRQVLEQKGEINLWKIAMKPGRPLTFGFSRPGQAYFGLPGNPVSAAITTLIFVNTAIRSMLGRESVLPPPLHLPLSDTLRKNPGRVEYQRAIMSQDLQGNWRVGTTGLQDSHVLRSLHKANCLIELDVDSTGAEATSHVKVYPFTHFSHPFL